MSSGDRDSLLSAARRIKDEDVERDTGDSHAGWLYYVVADGIRRQLLPARPDTAPPSNDDFEHAEPLPSNLPVSLQPMIGNATVQPGESVMAPDATGTISYSFQPTATQPVQIDASAPYWGVFEGTNLASLTRVGGFTFDATAGRTYWIGLGCSGFWCHLRSSLRLTYASTAPPALKP